MPAVRFAGVLAVVLIVGLFQLLGGRDTCRGQVLDVVRSSGEVRARLGEVREVSVWRTVSVQDAISVDDKFVPGYRSYVLSARGTRATARLTIRTGLKDCSPTITSMETD